MNAGRADYDARRGRGSTKSLTPASSGPQFFRSAAEFRQWLETYGASATELLVGYHKVATGKPSLTWAESVDEALCFGWIDSVRRRLSDAAYCIRFTPRRRGSVWSAINVARVAELTAQGRMRPAGSEAFARRTEGRTGVYSYEQQRSAVLAPAEVRRFKRRPGAWRYFEGTPPGYRRVLLNWIGSAKRPETRARRLEQLIEASGNGQRLFR